MFKFKTFLLGTVRLRLRIRHIHAHMCAGAPPPPALMKCQQEWSTCQLSKDFKGQGEIIAVIGQNGSELATVWFNVYAGELLDLEKYEDCGLAHFTFEETAEAQD